MRLLLLALLLFHPSGAAPATVAELSTGAHADLARVARDTITIGVALSPDVAASAGLFDDGLAVPSFAPCALRCARSCRKPRNGASPVPGPTMITGTAGSSGSRKPALVSRMVAWMVSPTRRPAR